MNIRLISAILLAAYTALLVKVMVLKDLPMLTIGKLMLNFAGVDSGHGPNFVPFTTIVPYLFGFKGLLIAGVNIIGNIILLIPVGFLLPLIFRNLDWKKSLALAVVSGLVIEVLQVALQVGIFDIDDVILNALGAMIGYGAYIILARLTPWVRQVTIALVLLVVAAAAVFAYFSIGISFGPAVRFNESNNGVAQGGDLCGGTGGAGEVVSKNSNTFTIKKNDGSTQAVTLSDGAAINTSAGSIPLAELQIGKRATLVGGPNPDGSFTADAVFVCN